MSQHRAGGVIFLSQQSGRVMLCLRSRFSSYPRTWSFWGGMIKPNETILEGISRELNEEIKVVPNIKKVLPLDISRSNDGNFDYYTILAIVQEEFIPITNHENDGFAWVRIGNWPRPLHPGALKLLTNKSIHRNLINIWKELVVDK